MLSQPIERAMPDDRRAGGSSSDSNRRASGHHVARPARVDGLERVVAAARRREPIAGGAARRPRRPCPPGPSSHFWAGDGVDVRAGRRQVDRDRAGALRAIDDDERAPGVGDLGDPRDWAGPHRWPTGRATATTARVRSSMAASKAASDLVVLAAGRRRRRTRARSRRGRAGRRAPRCRRDARGAS